MAEKFQPSSLPRAAGWLPVVVVSTHSIFLLLLLFLLLQPLLSRHIYTSSTRPPHKTRMCGCQNVDGENHDRLRSGCCSSPRKICTLQCRRIPSPEVRSTKFRHRKQHTLLFPLGDEVGGKTNLRHGMDGDGDDHRIGTERLTAASYCPFSKGINSTTFNSIAIRRR